METNCFVKIIVSESFLLRHLTQPQMITATSNDNPKFCAEPEENTQFDKQFTWVGGLHERF
jgi:hypothetical protein